MKKKLKLGEGYFDTSDCRRRIILWDRPLDSTVCGFIRVGTFTTRYLTGKKVRITAEVLE